MNISRPAALTAYFFIACALGCALAYPIYLASGLNFERILSRTILVCFVVLFYPAFKLLRFSQFSDLGFQPHQRYKTSINAWLIGIIMLIPISWFFNACGYRVWEPLAAPPFISPLSTILLAILSGTLIGLIEETFFRGVTQSVLLEKFTPLLAIVFVNIIYSSVHFLEVPDEAFHQTITWSSGFTLFLSAFQPLLNIASQWDSWLALFAAGIFLSLIRLHTNNLFWCIGLHAGWVTHIKVFKSFTDRNSNASCSSWAGDYDNYVGEFSLIWITLLLIAVWWTMRNKKIS